MHMSPIKSHQKSPATDSSNARRLTRGAPHGPHESASPGSQNHAPVPDGYSPGKTTGAQEFGHTGMDTHTDLSATERPHHPGPQGANHGRRKSASPGSPRRTPVPNGRSPEKQPARRNLGRIGMDTHTDLSATENPTHPGLHGANHERDPITSLDFNLMRLAALDSEERVKALDDFFVQHESKLVSTIGFDVENILGQLWSSLLSMLEKGPVRFTELSPKPMRCHWDGMLVQYVGYARKDINRVDQRHANRYQTLRDDDGIVSESSSDSEGGSLAAARDLTILFDSVPPYLTSRQRHVLEVVRECLPVNPSARFIASQAGCSPTTVINLLKKIRTLAPKDVRDRWSAEEPE